MSFVTAITIQLSCAEESPDETESDGIVKIKAWITKNYQYGANVNLTSSLDRHFSGNKHPQCDVWGAGFNYFPDDAFIEFWKTLEWEYPENAILILQPEDGYTKVFRGKDELGEL